MVYISNNNEYYNTNLNHRIIRGYDMDANSAPKIHKGKLYGIGIGPGDPELMTLKAKRILESCDVVFAPKKSVDEDSTALRIVKGAACIENKRIIESVFSMSKDPNEFWRCGRSAADTVLNELTSGNNVAFITLGDVSVYSTFAYMQQYVQNKGFAVEIVPGIPSFCGGAAAAGLPLCLGSEGLAIVPSVGDNGLIEKTLASFDSIVVMKVGHGIPKLIAAMSALDIPLCCATVVGNIGMDGEYIGPLDASREYGYFTTVIIRKNALRAL
jgi:precorrin-2/cobalt-factor-2 C20-methyltransferase